VAWGRDGPIGKRGAVGGAVLRPPGWWGRLAAPMVIIPTVRPTPAPGRHSSWLRSPLGGVDTKEYT